MLKISNWNPLSVFIFLVGAIISSLLVSDLIILWPPDVSSDILIA